MRAVVALVVLFVGVAMVRAEPPTTPQAVPLTPEVVGKLRDIAFQAAREGDLDTLRGYFMAGQPVNERNTRGDTLLTVAAYHGQEQAVETILAQPSVQVDARNKMGLTALAAAGFKGHTAIVERLIQSKADVNAANASGQTALMFAALTGRVKTVEALLSAAANPGTTDRLGNTALSLAQGQGADAVVRLLEAKRR